MTETKITRQNNNNLLGIIIGSHLRIKGKAKKRVGLNITEITVISTVGVVSNQETESITYSRKRFQRVTGIASLIEGCSLLVELLAGIAMLRSMLLVVGGAARAVCSCFWRSAT